MTVGDRDHEVHADMDTIAVARKALAGAGCVVAVGSGTICDIGKKATEGGEPLPYIVVQTACSVNAFSDDMAVLLVHGAKRDHALALAGRAGHRPGGHRGRARRPQPGGRG